MKNTLLSILLLLLAVGVCAQKNTQTIRGQVSDIESGIPLPGANVVIIKNGDQKAVATDANGSFVFVGMEVGRYLVKVSFVGYENIELPEIMLNSAKECVVDIKLKEQVTKLDDVTVLARLKKDEALNPMATVSARSFSVEETRRYAGSLDDPARMASAFAGVSTGNVQDNAIIVRGNAPKGIVWMLEGVQIPNPTHFADGNVSGGGFVTMFSSQLLTNSDFYTGAFPSEYGNGLAGVFDMKLRNGNNQQSEHAVQIGVLGIDVASEGPFKKGNQASYLFNYRYSTFALVKAILPGQQVPTYQDLSFKFNFPTQKFGTFSLWGIGGVDKVDEPTTTDSTQWISSWDRVQYNWKAYTGATGFTHHINLGQKTYINSTLSATGYVADYREKYMTDSLTLTDNNSIRINNDRLMFHTYVNHKFNSKLIMRTGITANVLLYNLNLQTEIDHKPPMIPIVNEKGQSELIQTFSQWKYNITDILVLNAGFYNQYFTLTGKATFEPRAALKWNINEKNALSFGYGNHSQMEELRFYFAKATVNGIETQPNKNLAFARANHFVLGYDRKLTDNMHLKIEPYFQYLYNVPVIHDSTESMLNFAQNWFINNAYVNEGTGRNMGVDITLERFFTNNFYYMATTSVFDAKYAGSNGILYNSRYNRNYVFNLLGGKEFFLGQNKQNILGINFRLSYKGGDRSYFVNINESEKEQQIVYDYSRPFARRLPDVWSSDFTITYRKNKKHYSSEWALQIKNIVASKDNYDDYYNLRNKTVVLAEGTKISVPSLSYKIEF
jgi:hypothetical protein